MMMDKMMMNRRRILKSVGFGSVTAFAAGACVHGKSENGVRSIVSFGAVGDGNADDTRAIQEAVDSGGGVIYFPKGRYRITESIIVDLDKAGFTAILGVGIAEVIMNGEGPAFRFVGTHKSTADPSNFEETVWQHQRMPSVQGISIVGDHADASGIEADGTMQLIISQVLIRKALHGIRLVKRNRNVIVSDCHIYDNRGIGVYYDSVDLHQSNITGCHISYNGGGGIVVRGGNVCNLHITGCDIESNMAESTEPTANVFIDCSSPIRGIVAEVSITGCTIQHNSFSEESSNIRIIGYVDPAENVRMGWIGNVAITGNILSDVQTNIHMRHARNITVTGNIFWEGFTHDVLLEACSNIVFGTNTFDRNPIYERGKNGHLRNPKNGLYIHNSVDCTFSGLHINRARADVAALYFDNCSRINITNCSILDCEGISLLLKDVTLSRVSDCLIHNTMPVSLFTPIKVTGGGNNQIADNLGVYRN